METPPRPSRHEVGSCGRIRTGRAHPIGQTELHESSSEGAEGGRRREKFLDVAPVHLDTHIAVASAVLGMGEAVPPPIAGPPRLEPFGGTRLLENVTDVGNQQGLRMVGKVLNHNIFNSENLLVKGVIILAGLYSIEIFDMVIAGRGYSCAPTTSNIENK